MSFEYSAPVELFLAKRAKNGRGNYWRFSTAAEALRFAVEDLRTPKALGAWLQVGESGQQHRNPAAVRSRCASLSDRTSSRRSLHVLNNNPGEVRLMRLFYGSNANVSG